MHALLLSLLLSLARAEIVDRVEAVVEDQVVMTSDLRLDEALGALDPSPSPFWRRPTDPLSRVLDGAVVRALAGDVTVYQPSDEAVQERLETLIRTHFATRAEWHAFLDGWGADEAAMRNQLRRRMVVERYLERNVAASPDDAVAWFRACEALLAVERSRMRIRVIPPRSAAP